MTKREGTPAGTSATPDPAEEAIHITQTSLDSVAPKSRDSRPTDNPTSADTLLSGPSPQDEMHSEMHDRLGSLEAGMTELSARVRLLEKQTATQQGGVRWMIALLFFVLLAVSWQLVSGLR
jgi:hypothetical protein